jgi:hypothetical protein
VAGRLVSAPRGRLLVLQRLQPRKQAQAPAARTPETSLLSHLLLHRPPGRLLGAPLRGRPADALVQRLLLARLEALPRLRCRALARLRDQAGVVVVV